MHQLLRCPSGRPHDDGYPNGGGSALGPATGEPGGRATDLPFALRLIQNRSAFPAEGRPVLIVLLALCLAATITSAIKGYYLVPIAVLAAMAALVVALEWFSRQSVPAQMLEVDFDHVTLSDHRGNVVSLPAYWARLEEIERTPLDHRLYLVCRDRRIEIGRCIGLAERKAVAPLIRVALAHARGERS